MNTDWQTDFDKKFIKPFGDGTRNAVWSLDMEEKVKAFITNLLDKKEKEVITKIQDLGWIGTLQREELEQELKALSLKKEE